MAFKPPVYNLLATWWDAGHTPADNPFDVGEIPCQAYRFGRQVGSNAFMMLRFPPEYSTLPFPITAGVVSLPIVECPAGSGTYYRVHRALWMHRGFVNEYIALSSFPCRSDGIQVDSDSDLV